MAVLPRILRDLGAQMPLNSSRSGVLRDGQAEIFEVSGHIGELGTWTSQFQILSEQNWEFQNYKEPWKWQGTLDVGSGRGMD